MTGEHLDPPKEQRTIELIERRCRLCRLPPEEMAFLLREHASHLKVVPTERKHLYRITPTRRVGMIQGPKIRYIIHPKLPYTRLLAFLSPEAALPSGWSEGPINRDAPDPGCALLDLLVHRLLDLLGGQFQHGLQQGYTQKRDHGPYLRGRLDVPSQMRAAAAPDPGLHSEQQDRSTDILCNQILRSTVDRLLQADLLPERTRERLQLTMNHFRGVSSIPLTPERFARAQQDRSAMGYRPVLDLCNLLANGMQPEGETEHSHQPCLLVDLERLFERFVSLGLREVLQADSRFTLMAQPYLPLARAQSGQIDLMMRPDLLLCTGSQAIMALDAKWKRLPASGPGTEDLYQLMAYCQSTGAPQGALIYPGQREQSRSWKVEASGLTIHAMTVQVTGSVDICRRSLQSSGQALLQQAIDILGSLSEGG